MKNSRRHRAGALSEGSSGRSLLFVCMVSLCAWALGSSPDAAATRSVRHDSIELNLLPRVCTLAAHDENCDTVVQAQWRSPQDESLCLVIVGQPQIKRCWEHFSEGSYTVELQFSEDLIVELRDPQLQQVLVAEAITVIREALQLRRKRRQPWNILF